MNMMTLLTLNGIQTGKSIYLPRFTEPRSCCKWWSAIDNVYVAKEI